MLIHFNHFSFDTTKALLPLCCDQKMAVWRGSYFIITALPQHFSSSIKQMQRGCYRFSPWWLQLTGHSIRLRLCRKGRSLECDCTLSLCKSCIYFGSEYSQQHADHVSQVWNVKTYLSLETLLNESAHYRKKSRLKNYTVEQSFEWSYSLRSIVVSLFIWESEPSKCFIIRNFKRLFSSADCF